MPPTAVRGILSSSRHPHIFSEKQIVRARVAAGTARRRALWQDWPAHADATIEDVTAGDNGQAVPVAGGQTGRRQDGRQHADGGRAPGVSPAGEMEGPRGSGGGLAGLCAGGSPFFSQRAAWPCLCLSGLGRAALAAGGLAAAQCRGLFAGAGRGVGHDDAGPGPLASATGPGLAEDGLHTGCGGRADPAGGRSPAQSRLPQGRGLRSPCPGARLSAGLGPAVAAGRAAA